MKHTLQSPATKSFIYNVVRCYKGRLQIMNGTPLSIDKATKLKEEIGQVAYNESLHIEMVSS